MSERVTCNQALNYLSRRAGKNCLNGGQNFQGIEAICEGIEAIFQSALKTCNFFSLTCTKPGLLNPSGVSKFAVFMIPKHILNGFITVTHQWFHLTEIPTKFQERVFSAPKKSIFRPKLYSGRHCPNHSTVQIPYFLLRYNVALKSTININRIKCFLLLVSCKLINILHVLLTQFSPRIWI